jgi:hypothetical protein
MKKFLVSAMVAGTMVLTAGAAPSWADTITFNNSSIHPDGVMTVGNTVSLSQGVIDAVARVLPLAGFNISGSCGPLGNTNFGCINFTTGTFIGADASTTSNDYDYSGVGSLITVTGGIASLGLPNNTVLWVGAFDPNSNVILQFDDVCISAPTQCTGSVTGTLAPGTFNPVLANALGVVPGSIGGNDQSLFLQFTGIPFPTTGFPTGSGMGNTNQLQVVTPAVVINPNAPVPESGSLILVGIGLVAGARYLRRPKIAA